MSLLDILDEKVLSPAASYIKIISQYKSDDNTIFCFVEGIEDISFYSQFIERNIENELKFIVCNGKGNVIDNHKSLDWNFYSKKRILFFIDKDFDDYIGQELYEDDNIFITELYSIENYLVDEHTLRKFIIDNCLISDETIINLAVENFKIQHKEYIGQLKKISAWMMYCRKHNYKVNFNDIKISDLFFINKEGILKKKDLGSYETSFKYICDKTGCDNFSLPEIKEFYKKIDLESKPQKFIRGKYDLYFMFLYLKYISEEIVLEISKEVKKFNANAPNKKLIRPKLLIQVNESNIFQILNNKVKLPIKLKEFIDTIN
ncbi:DUF4435 domain-containing protein [Chryseobacterium takakiae]|uniref:DUF4435 domain-containing protein n=1 Tax=Chryseobacterium takakiae TaxID=1302685 RepID=A0A1M4TG75_9FLAO|nr:DUF4435 domain-containing protein [Chryseobacterium takakiae]SHE43398.1 Protein of unknown function [Chryseobacterium takakiae]